MITLFLGEKNAHVFPRTFTFPNLARTENIFNIHAFWLALIKRGPERKQK